MILYSMPSSGNSYKVRLLLALLGKHYDHIACEHRSEALSEAKAAGHIPMGKVPTLHLEDGRILSESNAILWYIGRETCFIPKDAFEQAQMLGWMFFEQNRHEPVIAVRAGLRCYPDRAAQATQEELDALLEQGHALMQIMEDGLEGRDWLVGADPTLADIALYAYTHTGEERGGFEMSRFPNIQAWCARVAALPNYVGLFEHG